MTDTINNTKTNNNKEFIFWPRDIDHEELMKTQPYKQLREDLINEYKKIFNRWLPTQSEDIENGDLTLFEKLVSLNEISNQIYHEDIKV